MEKSNYFKYICQHYGTSTKKKMQITLKLSKSLASYRNRRDFLTQCRRYGFVPKSLQVNLSGFKHCIDDNTMKRLSKKFSNILLSEAIKQIFRNISHKTKLSNDNALAVKQSLSADHYNEFKNRVKQSYIKDFKIGNEKLKVKFKNLIEPYEKRILNFNEKWLKNLTNIEIPTNVANILAMDKKFNLPTTNAYVETEKIISNVEPVLQRLGKCQRIKMRNDLVNIITNFKRTPYQKTKEERLTLKHFSETKSFLKDHPELCVTKADKGNVTVLIHKNEYHNKMMELLSDEKTYSKSRYSLTYTIETLVRKEVNQWVNDSFISEETANYLTTNNAVCAKAFLQIKIHKTGFPARLLVDCIGSPTYKLAKWYSKILRNVVGKSKHSIKNSEDFINKLRNIMIPAGYELVSLDVISLFTKIAKELVFEAVEERWNEINSHTTLPKKQFINGLKIILENCIFQYKGEFFKQLFGSPMGSPVSPVCADLVLEILETKVLRSLKYKVPCFFRFVDDCYSMVPSNKKDNFKSAFNDYDKQGNIQFTMEVEEHNELAFLDTKTIRMDDGRIKIDWYHKPTWSGRYLNFHSSLPISYKRNTVTILTSKILKLSDIEFHECNLKLLYETLIENGYPFNFIKSGVERTKLQLNSPSVNSNQNLDINPVIPVAIPYVKGLFEQIKKLFKDTDVLIVGKGDNNLNNSVYTRLKDGTPFLDQSNLIYVINCDCGLCYVGQTHQKLRKRIYDHKYNINIGNKSHSALCEHAIENCNHKINWDEVKIIGKEDVKHRRNILEMIKIKKTPNAMNYQLDSIMLPSAYFSIM